MRRPARGADANDYQQRGWARVVWTYKPQAYSPGPTRFVLEALQAPKGRGGPGE